MKKYFHRGFLIVAMLFVAVTYTGAYFSDSVSVSGNTFTAGTWDAGPDVLINEVYSHASGEEVEWIELVNLTSVSLSLSGYTIEDNNASPKDLSTYTIPANGYLVLHQGAGNDFSFGLNDPGDILILKEASVMVDQVAYGNYDDGNIADNAPVPATGESVTRMPDGADTDVDNVDFQIDATPTKGGPNG